ncbi:hypothetical protein [Rhodospirillum sp. A1_3_36]|uniref:hypothetical protein n=1 Tax=Rhodospirillum sp. A1_3_36 TaxID=3391666 RepID=UPI0039A5B097
MAHHSLPRILAVTVLSLAMTPLFQTGAASAQSPEDLLATYQTRCTSEAHREAARKGPQEAMDHGTLCDDLAKRIQTGLKRQETGAQASPLARPNPTVWPDSGLPPSPGSPLPVPNPE